jgi:hypothetical protein
MLALSLTSISSSTNLWKKVTLLEVVRTTDSLGWGEQIGNILIDVRQHSSVLDILSFRGTDCDNDHCLIVTNLGRNCH